MLVPNDLKHEKAEQIWIEAQTAYEVGQLRRARKLALMAFNAGLPGSKTKFLMGASYWHLGKMTSAFKIFEQGLLAQQIGCEAYYYIAKKHRLAGDFKSALENYALVLKGSRDILFRALTLREIEGMRLINEEKYAILVKRLSQANQADDSYTTLSEKRGLAIFAMLRGERHLAFLGLRELQKEFPKCAEIYRDFAYLHLRENDLTRAILNLKKGVEYFPYDYEMNFDLAHALFRIGHHDESNQVLAKMVKRQLASPAVYLNMGNNLIALGRSVGAIRAYRKALERESSFIPALFNLATIYHQSGDFDLAQSHYLEILETESAHVLSLYNLALLYYETGDYTESVKLLKKCLFHDPGFESAVKNLRFINLARVCFPEDSSEEIKISKQHAWWIGAASISILLLISLVKGLL